ncbi:MAG: thiamine pyrophosphate-binding protein [Acidobacteriota bacterium]
MSEALSGGDRVARVLAAHGVRFLFTLCGGHISPILVAAKRRGIRVVDTRHEVSATFAADAVSRLGGVPGVAAVTAGPGVTNAITAIKNAALAQSPLVVLGGATATLLKGRGALQDIDQRALVAPHVKWLATVERVRDLEPALERAFAAAAGGVPGPVFVECPVDLLYEEATVLGWYRDAQPKGKGLGDRVARGYLERHARRLFAPGGDGAAVAPVAVPEVPSSTLARMAERLQRAERPVVVVGSQALADPRSAAQLAAAVAALGAPVYLAGMARGLLGPRHPLQMRHHRRRALREADCVVLAGVPADFRLDYGRQIARRAVVLAANRSARDLRQNRRPTVGAVGDAGRFLIELGDRAPLDATRIAPWMKALRSRDEEREAEIERESAIDLDGVNPLRVCREIDRALADDSVLVADGGDFVATAAYSIRPRGPLSWLDPGVFGTLGVGGGFALGAKLCRPQSEVWLLWGDGSAAYSLAEVDTMVRHGLPVIAVVGNDAAWTQIAREQVPMLGDDVAVTLRRTDYERVAEGYGGEGLRVERREELPEALAEAKRLAAAGHPVLVNVHLGRTEFRKGSISI